MRQAIVDRDKIRRECGHYRPLKSSGQVARKWLTPYGLELLTELQKWVMELYGTQFLMDYVAGRKGELRDLKKKGFRIRWRLPHLNKTPPIGVVQDYLTDLGFDDVTVREQPPYYGTVTVEVNFPNE